MGFWMEYVYMQKPYPEEVTGVEVNLTVIDPNDNHYQIGTVTTEPSGIFAFDFSPSTGGLYKIRATFQGSDSYWPSYGETFLLVEGKTKDSKQTSYTGSIYLDSLLIIVLLGGITVGGGLLASRNKKSLHWLK